MRPVTFVKLIFGLMVILLALSGFGYFRYEQFLQEPIAVSGEHILIVSEGETANQVLSRLEKSHILSSRWWMRIYLERSGLSGRLKPGHFVLTEGMTPVDLGEALTLTGKYYVRQYALLPGTNLYEMSQQLHDAHIVDKNIFLKKVLSPEFCSELGVPADSLEGYLMPGKYTFSPSMTEEDVIREMHSRFLENWTVLVRDNEGTYEQYAKRYQMTDHELLTLASLIEKEAVREEEKPVIARVFLNRLSRKMKLQSDPTCVYPPLAAGEKPSPRRCHDPENRYSTYVCKGLPPGPIGAPNINSLKAVFSPYTGDDYKSILYFVARNDGTWRHYFSKSLSEHNQAVRYFLKKDIRQFEQKTPQPVYPH